MVFLGQPFKKGFHRHHAGVLAVGTQGITVLFTVVMQVLLITLQNRLGDVLGPDDGPLVAPPKYSLRVRTVLGEYCLTAIHSKQRSA